MAVELELTPIGSGFNRSLINTNFQRIEEALADAVSRSGGSPNMMESDLDLNSNDVLNAGTIETERLVVDGEEFLPDGVTAKGDPGDAATISVGSVTTGAAGSSVVITNSGTTSAAVFNFTIPRGDTGASGAGTGDMVAAQNLNDVASKPTAFANIKQAATESASGVVELATDAEAIAGVDTTRVVTPANLAAVLGAASNVQHFTASDTWTKPAVGTAALVYLWGGGGAGGRGTTQPRAGGGGGGGAYTFKLIPLSSLGATETVTIGAGGVATVSPNTNGAAGGDTSFGSLLTAFGGGGGSGSHGSDTAGGGGGGGGVVSAGGSTATTGTGGSGGTGISTASIAGSIALDGGGGVGGTEDTGVNSNGGYGVNGGGGGGGSGSTGSQSGTGGSSMFGGAGGGGGNDDGTAKAGGTSVYAGNGGAGAVGSNTATSGTAPSGGGGGAGIGTAGAGARGEAWVIVI